MNFIMQWKNQSQVTSVKMGSRKRQGGQKSEEQGTLKSRSTEASPWHFDLPECRSREHFLFGFACPISLQLVPGIEEDLTKGLLNECSSR